MEEDPVWNKKYHQAGGISEAREFSEALGGLESVAVVAGDMLI